MKSRIASNLSASGPCSPLNSVIAGRPNHAGEGAGAPCAPRGASVVPDIARLTRSAGALAGERPLGSEALGKAHSHPLDSAPPPSPNVPGLFQERV